MIGPTTTLSTWNDRFVQRLCELADRPVLLVLVLLAANAVARPYANITHDTRLYSVQVLNRAENGSYNDDFYFRYGSQDDYSVFSFVLAPLVKRLGLEAAFFLVYLAGNTLFIVALVGLVRRLVENRFLVVVTLVYLVIVPLNYGGLYTFHVHEQFLTPRLLAVSLVLIGLNQLLDSRYFTSLFLMILAGMLHPLMATGGFLMWAGVLLVDKLGPKWAILVTTVITLATAVFLAVPANAGRYLGFMDDEWRHAILTATPFNFTSEWELRDWANVAFCGVGLTGGVCLSWRNSDRRRAYFYVIAALVGVAAVLGTFVAEQLPYALLFQGQPYRALWVLKVLQVPLCFLLADRLLRMRQLVYQLLAFIPLIFLLSAGPASLWYLEWTMPLYFLPMIIMAFRGLDAEPRRADWLVRSVALALVLGELAWSLYKNAHFLSDWRGFLKHEDVLEFCSDVLRSLGPIPWMLFVLGMLSRHGVGWRSLGLTFLTVGMSVQCSFFFLSNSAYVREHGAPHLRDIMFARDFLNENETSVAKKPTVYSSYGRVEYVWLEMKSNSYFDWWQTGGFIYNRQMTMEGVRRARIVGPFAVGRFQETEQFLEERTKQNVREFFHVGMDAKPPTTAELARLCDEPDLDYLILKIEFPGLYSATNGRIYVYDCRRVRAALD